MGRDPYEILGIARDATLAEAGAAYRRLAQLFHPDRLAGVRDDVRAEAERRLREANDAIRSIRRALGRPLVVAGHGRERHDPPAPTQRATAREARLYEVDLRALGGNGLHVRWYGEHAAAVLAALRSAHRIDGPIRQLEWGTYEVVYDGFATRRLLTGVGPCAGELVEVEVLHGPGINLPARDGDADRGHEVIGLDEVLALLVDDEHYAVIADVY